MSYRESFLGRGLLFLWQCGQRTPIKLHLYFEWHGSGQSSDSVSSIDRYLRIFATGLAKFVTWLDAPPSRGWPCCQRPATWIFSKYSVDRCTNGFMVSVRLYMNRTFHTAKWSSHPQEATCMFSALTWQIVRLPERKNSNLKFPNYILILLQNFKILLSNFEILS